MARVMLTPVPLARLTGLLALAGMTGCADFFHPVAPAVAPLRLALQVAAPAVPAVAPVSDVGGARQALVPNPGGAFDKADAVVLRLVSGDRVLLDDRRPLASSTGDRVLSLEVELPSSDPVPASLAVVLLRGRDTLFTGGTTATLTAGRAAEVTVPLTGRAARLEIGGPYTARPGDAVPLDGGLLFVTGDILSAGAERTATLRSLDPAVLTVRADRSVIAVARGTGRIEATLEGFRDTAAVTVLDPCLAPFPVVTLGQAISGALASTDCLDGTTGVHVDGFALTLSAPTLVRATYQATGFDPFLSVQTGEPALSVGASGGAPGALLTEFQLPAGSFTVRASSVARPSGAPAPPATGAYSLTLAAATEPQAGCPTPSDFVTWLSSGAVAVGRVTADDCRRSGLGGVGDQYGAWLGPRDTVVATILGPPGMRTMLGSDVRLIPATGTVQWAFTGDERNAHQIQIGTDGVTAPLLGTYTINTRSGISTGYDPCAQPPILASIVAGSTLTRAGRLQPSVDCSPGTVVQDVYEMVTPSLPIRLTMTSPMSQMGPGVSLPDGSLGWYSPGSGSKATEHVLVPGQRYRAVAVAQAQGIAGTSGAYSLAFATVPIAQEGCANAATFADFGVTISARLTAADCLDSVGRERRVDGYSVLVRPGETVRVTTTATFPLLLTRWEAGAFVESRSSATPNEPLTLTYTNPSTASRPVFQAFYVLDWVVGTYGTYTMTIGGTRVPPVGPLRAPALPMTIEQGADRFVLLPANAP
jgi:hypothetical protein